MKPIALIALLVSLHATAGSPSADELALRHLKEVLWPKAYAEQDQALLDRILHDSFQMIDSSGSWSDKAGELDWISKNKPSYEDFEYVIKRLDVYPNDTAVVAGEGRIRGTGTDGPYRMTYQSSNILIKDGQRWRAIASHVSGIERE